MITIPMRTQGSNAREPWQARHGRVKRERKLVATALLGQKRPPIPCTVLLTRVSAGELDDDNVRAALKGVRDQIAQWLGVDDRSPQVRYQYAQVRGVRGRPEVRIEFGPPASGAQLVLGEFAPQPFEDQLDPAGMAF